eukprot:scaffold3631_cov264-Prasinococcus_capsulatus_cf.AAC.2
MVRSLCPRPGPFVRARLCAPSATLSLSSSALPLSLTVRAARVRDSPTEEPLGGAGGADAAGGPLRRVPHQQEGVPGAPARSAHSRGVLQDL